MADVRRIVPIVIATSAFWVLLFGAYSIYGLRRPAAQAIEILPPPSVTISPQPSQIQQTSTPEPLRIYVSGAVRAPGVYRLEPGALLEDAIEGAGGAGADADLVAVNLAYALHDGEHVHVPEQGEAPTPAPMSSTLSTLSQSTPAASKQAGPAQPVDINTAALEDLVLIPKVGPKTAERIIAGRPYATVDDLLRVKGIGETTLEQIRPYARVE